VSKKGGVPTRHMRKVHLEVVTREACAEAYEDSAFPLPVQSIFCASSKESGKDACQGDSGGPAYDANTKAFMGLVTTGYGRGNPAYPGIYIMISKYLPYIREFL
jgi:trypsin